VRAGGVRGGEQGRARRCASRWALADLASFAGDALFGALPRELMAAKKQARL